MHEIIQNSPRGGSYVEFRSTHPIHPAIYEWGSLKRIFTLRFKRRKHLSIFNYTPNQAISWFHTYKSGGSICYHLDIPCLTYSLRWLVKSVSDGTSADLLWISIKRSVGRFFVNGGSSSWVFCQSIIKWYSDALKSNLGSWNWRKESFLAAVLALIILQIPSFLIAAFSSWIIERNRFSLWAKYELLAMTLLTIAR